MTASITLEKAKRNFDDILEIVDREGDVYIVKKNRTYHLHRELTENEAVQIGKQAQKEYKSGKTRSFEQFVNSEYPEHVHLLEDNKR